MQKVQYIYIHHRLHPRLPVCLVRVLGAAGEPMHIDQIVQQVGRKWQALRKTDNLPYHTKIRCAWGVRTGCCACVGVSHEVIVQA